jgi:hypothetical protein
MQASRTKNKNKNQTPVNMFFKWLSKIVERMQIYIIVKN